MIDWDGIRARLLQVSGVTGYVGSSTSARIYPVRLPQDPKLPAIVITRIAGPRSYTMTSQSGTVRGMFQIDSFGTTALEVGLLADEVRIALTGFSGTIGTERIQGIYQEGDTFTWDEGAALFRVTQTFTVWFEEATS